MTPRSARVKIDPGDGKSTQQPGTAGGDRRKHHRAASKGPYKGATESLNSEKIVFDLVQNSQEAWVRLQKDLGWNHHHRRQAHRSGR